jgi:hypothetical protein
MYALKNPTVEGKAKYLTYRNLYNKFIRQIIKLHVEKQLRKHSNNSRQTWNTLNTATRKNKNKSTDILSLLSLNSKITDPTEMANKFTEHFTSMATVISNKVIPTDRPPDRDTKINDSIFNNFTTPITRTEFF